jgi:hypothetical protein
MMLRSALVLAVALPALAGCVSNGAHYEPIIDAPRNQQYYTDLGDCQHLAENRNLIDGETANRAALGAGVGAAIGVTRRGDDLENAAVGAAVGGAIGGATGLYDANAERRHIVMSCMSGRGYRVLG